MKKTRNIFLENKKGLTLIELVVVIVIITFLLSLAYLAYRNQIFKGNDGKRKGDIHKIQVALEEYEKDNECYPEPILLAECDPGTGLIPYLNNIPCDPTTKEPYLYVVDGVACPTWYWIFAKLENKKDKDVIPGVGPEEGYDFNYYASSPNAPIPYTPTLYGCKSGICVEVYHDSETGETECSPTWAASDCYGECVDEFGSPKNECL